MFCSRTTEPRGELSSDGRREGGGMCLAGKSKMEKK